MKRIEVGFDISDEVTKQLIQFLADSGRVIEGITLVGNGTMDFVPRSLKLNISEGYLPDLPPELGLKKPLG
jgi:hypothetical protein